MSTATLHNSHFAGSSFCLEAPGPTAALLFHGFTATCHEVAHLGKTLHAAGYTTTGPLLPGHGTSPDDLNRVRWQDWTAAAEDAYADLARRYSNIIVGGESNGGLLALYLAARHPEIAAVLAYAPGLILPLSGFQRLQLRLAAPFVPSLPKNDLGKNTYWQGYQVNPLKAVLQLLHLQSVVRERLPAITAPILIVQGRLDRTVVPRSAEVVYQQVSSPVKRLHWLEKTGHCVLLDCEQAAAEQVTLAFLQEIGL